MFRCGFLYFCCVSVGVVLLVLLFFLIAAVGLLCLCLFCVFCFGCFGWVLFSLFCFFYGVGLLVLLLLWESSCVDAVCVFVFLIDFLY